MNKIISKKAAAYTVIAIMSLLVIFHILILTGIIPYDIAWGGKLKTQEDMVRFETGSILMAVAVILIVTAHTRMLPFRIDKRTTRIALWLIVAAFALNTIGNLFAQTATEKVFGIITIVLAILCIRLATDRE